MPDRDIYIKKSNNKVDKIHDIESQITVNCANFYANARFLYYTFYIICITNETYIHIYIHTIGEKKKKLKIIILRYTRSLHFYYLQFDGTEKNRAEKYADRKGEQTRRQTQSRKRWLIFSSADLSITDARLSALRQNNRALNGKLISIDGGWRGVKRV